MPSIEEQMDELDLDYIRINRHNGPQYKYIVGGGRWSCDSCGKTIQEAIDKHREAISRTKRTSEGE